MWSLRFTDFVRRLRVSGSLSVLDPDELLLEDDERDEVDREESEDEEDDDEDESEERLRRRLVERTLVPRLRLATMIDKVLMPFF